MVSDFRRTVGVVIYLVVINVLIRNPTFLE